MAETTNNKKQDMDIHNLRVQSKFFLGNVEMELKTRKVKNALGETIEIQYIGPVENNQ